MLPAIVIFNFTPSSAMPLEPFSDGVGVERPR